MATPSWLRVAMRDHHSAEVTCPAGPGPAASAAPQTSRTDHVGTLAGEGAESVRNGGTLP